jgi:Arabinose efflux permease
MASGETIESYVPSRLDGLPWSRWHWLIVVALGATWILDGLEVTLAGALGGILTRPDTLGLTPVEVGASATYYLTGAVIGALLFGYGADRFGRKKLFFITVAVYLFGTALSAFSWNFASYAFFRALTGAGIGGEYAAINSAIDELIPARIRGRVDLMINGSYWVGAALGAIGTLILLDPQRLPVWLGWRFAFGIGATLGLVVIFFRQWIPESPRWLMIHGRNHEAEQIVTEVERLVKGTACGERSEMFPTRIRTRTHTPSREIWNAIVHEHRQRSILGFVLMLTQAFFYNAIFFTYALVLMKFYGVPEQNVGGYLLPFAIGNVLGPIVLGHLFDTVGRKKMIAITYALAGLFVGANGMALLHGPAHRRDANAGVVDYFLHRLRRSQFRLSYGERNIPVGNPRPGHRHLLCNRDAGRWSRRADFVWLVDRDWIERGVVCRLSGRRQSDDSWRVDRGINRGAGRAKVARGWCGAAIESILIAN